MWFAWRWMVISEKEFPDVVLHGESSGTGFVVPLEINACVFLLLPFVSDRVVFLEVWRGDFVRVVRTHIR